MKKFSLMLIACLSLSACVSSNFVSDAANTGKSVTDERDFHTQVDDKTITYHVHQALNLNKRVKKGSNISVSSFNRVVLLTGTARNSDIKHLASSIASSVSKVRRVHNEIKVAPNSSFKDAANDTWLTTKIKSSLIAERGLHSAKIKVVTENRTAYLLGLVTRDQGNLATNVTRHVPGVKKVVKLFEYTSHS